MFYNLCSTCQQPAASCSCTKVKTENVFYTGPNLQCVGVGTNDNLTLIIQKLNDTYCNLLPPSPRGLLRTVDGMPITSTPKFITDETGVSSILSLSTETVTITPIANKIGLTINNTIGSTGLDINNVGSGFNSAIGINLTNASGLGAGILINNTNITSTGIHILNNTTEGKGLYINSASTSGTGILLTNSNAGDGIDINNSAAGNGIIISNSGTGKGINLTNSAGTGISIVHSSTFPGISIISTSANASPIYISNAGNVEGIKISNAATTKAGLDIDNTSTGIGIELSNTSTGTGFSLINSSTGTGISINATNGTAMSILTDGSGISIISSALASSQSLFIQANHPTLGRCIYANLKAGGQGVYSRTDGIGTAIVANADTTSTGKLYEGWNAGVPVFTVNKTGVVSGAQFQLNALNAPPASATAAGVLGEIRIDANFIYVCTATNTWKRVAIATW